MNEVQGKIRNINTYFFRVNESASGGWAALMWASWYGHLEAVQMLVRVHGIKVQQMVLYVQKVLSTFM